MITAVKLPRLLSLLILLAATGMALGQNPAPAPAAAQGAVRSEGERIALRGTDNGVGACSVCHGALGEGSAPAGFPRIAGMAEYYLAKQLRSYADGSRPNAIMTPIAARLSPQQIAALAGYYAALAAPPAAQAGQADPALLERGRVLAEIGDNGKRLQACINCHGPAGTGEPPTFPYLAGQHQAYLAASLADWKNGKRNTDPSRMMSEIAQRLDDRDRAAVAAYFAMQAPPAPAAVRNNLPLGSAARPVGPGAPSAATPQPTEGFGVEQGGPTTGGNQGPGGGSAASGNRPSSR